MLFRLNGFLLMAAMLFAGCTSEQQIRKSALRYFKDGNSAYLHRDYQNAIWNYRKAITMDSETPEFHFNLGLVYYELGNYPEALDAYMRVAELRPGLSDTYYNIALAYHRMEQSTDADRYYNRYQDMLSLRKAKELARKKAEMKQQEQPAVAAKSRREKTGGQENESDPGLHSKNPFQAQVLEPSEKRDRQHSELGMNQVSPEFNRPRFSCKKC